VPLCPQIPHELTRARAQDWGMARPERRNSATCLQQDAAAAVAEASWTKNRNMSDGHRCSRTQSPPLVTILSQLHPYLASRGTRSSVSVWREQEKERVHFLTCLWVGRCFRLLFWTRGAHGSSERGFSVWLFNPPYWWRVCITRPRRDDASDCSSSSSLSGPQACRTKVSRLCVTTVLAVGVSAKDVG
jgi:hypothetical protein